MTENNSYIKSAVVKSEYNNTAVCTMLNAVVTFLISFGVLQQLVTVTKADCSQFILALTTAAVSFAMFIAGKYSKLKISSYLKTHPRSLRKHFSETPRIQPCLYMREITWQTKRG